MNQQFTDDTIHTCFYCKHVVRIRSSQQITNVVKLHTEFTVGRSSGAWNSSKRHKFFCISMEANLDLWP